LAVWSDWHGSELEGSMNEEKAPPGWYPYGDGGEEGYWDGDAWTEQRRESTVAVAPEPTPPPSGPPAGWYPDAENPGGQRYWDGQGWSEHRTPPPPPGAVAPPTGGQTIYVERAGNGIPVAAMVCGIVGAIFGLIPITGVIALALGLVAFVLGIMGRRRVKRDPAVGRKGVATAGVILGVIAITLGIIGLVIVNDVANDLNSTADCLDNADTAAEVNDC
jgi:Protein of unknown function (DUF2510)